MTHTSCNIYLMLHLLCDFGQGILHPRDSSLKGKILLLSDCSSKYITPDLAGYILFSINKERNVWFPQLQVIYCDSICCHTKLHCTESRFSLHHTGNKQKGNTNRCTSGCDHLSRVDSKPPMLTLYIESLSVYHGCWEFPGTGQMPLSSCIIKLWETMLFSLSFTGQFLKKNHSVGCAIYAEGQMVTFVWRCVPAKSPTCFLFVAGAQIKFCRAPTACSEHTYIILYFFHEQALRDTLCFSQLPREISVWMESRAPLVGWPMVGW